MWLAKRATVATEQARYTKLPGGTSSKPRGLYCVVVVGSGVVVEFSRLIENKVRHQSPTTPAVTVLVPAFDDWTCVFLPLVKRPFFGVVAAIAVMAWPVAIEPKARHIRPIEPMPAVPDTQLTMTS